MNWVSLLGLVVLLLIAWAMSYYRREVKLKPIAWGIGLQLVFALIILREDHWSFVGMVLLGVLLALYASQKERARWTNRTTGFGIVVLFAAACGVGAYFLARMLSLTPLILVFLALLLLNARFKWVPRFQTYGFIALVFLAVGHLIANERYGVVIFQNFSGGVARFLNLSDYGAEFLFGNLAVERFFGPWKPDFPNPGTWPGFGFLFAFKVLPTIIFFGGFMGVLYYLGIMQKVIESVSRFVRWTIGTSGAETLSCSANIFVGQTEAPLLVKPFLNEMTKSELLTIMVGGFATIAGGVLAGYIAMGVPAGHLIAASVMSAPAALVIAKIVFPEKEHSVTAGDVKLPDISVGDNVLEAASNGISDGLKLAVNVGAMLIGFIALIAVIDVILNWLDYWVDYRLVGGSYYEYASAGLSPAKGEYAGFFPGSLKTLFGTLFRPLAWVMGVSWQDSAAVGNLLGIKVSLNEFVAFGVLGDHIHAANLEPRSIIIATYALCGFANFSSIGIQLGGISALAPERRSDLAKVVLRAMFGGALASWTTATIAGMFL